MLKSGMTVREAAETWVREFDAIQQGMIKKLMRFDPEDWHEVTQPAPCQRVYLYEDCCGGEIVKFNSRTLEYRVKRDRDGKKIWVTADEFDVEFDEKLPMWGTMWSFSDPCDIHWLEEGEGIEVLSRCGFRIYESEEFGFFFGIDAAGFDFYEAYWIPLYKARGLQWHDPKTEVAA